MMNIFILIYISIIGLILGSFINVIILRIKNNESFVKGRSYCPKCKKTLGVWDLVPVLSFIFLRGRCRYCGKKISIQYPVVEIFTALTLGFSYLFLDNLRSNIHFLYGLSSWLTFVFITLLLLFLLIIFVYDLKYYIIPDEVVFSALLMSVLVIISVYFFNYKFILLDNVLGMLIYSGFFAIQYFISKGQWVGGGDIKLGLLLGVVLGWQLSIASLMLAYILGATVSVVLIALKKKTKKDIIPFGPFLIAASFSMMFFGDRIVSWYSSLFIK